MNQQELTALFTACYGAGSEPIQCFFAPGRVNLIGEHIDYNGGYVFPAALSLGVSGALRLRGDRMVRLASANAAGLVSVDLTQPVTYDAVDGWGNYPKGILAYLAKAGAVLSGCDIYYSSNLPDGAGLSSSAALLVLTAYMLLAQQDALQFDGPQLARFCQQVENEFIGVNCGIMDQFAVAMGRPEQAILLDCATLAYEYVPFALGDYRLVIMNSNKKRELADSKYNERRGECDAALAILKQHRPLAALCAATPDEVAAYVTDATLQKRARHAVSENQRVLQAVTALRQGDMAAFAALLTASHQSLQHDYEVSGRELDALVASALATDGCLGARMTGAGFGGCAIAVVAAAAVADFCRTVGAKYTAASGLTADFYTAAIAGGVGAMPPSEAMGC